MDNEENQNSKTNSGRFKREKPKEQLELNRTDYKYIVGVRYTKAAIQQLFYSNIDSIRQCNKVILKTISGLEFGTVCSRPELIAEADFKESDVVGMIEREATSSDKNILNHIRTMKEPEEMEYCKQRIKFREMKMKLVSIEHLFSGEKVIFYFIADGRVDFRELVKDLARRYRTRIEMRQIGVRDEARMLSDYEHCGRELCCRTFMHELEPVTMRMAKMQKTTLDPSKISGHCGRLMCCLRFEDEVYKEHKSILPRKGDRVETEEHRGYVLNSQLLSKDIQISCDDGSYEVINFDDIIKHEPSQQRKQRSETTQRPSCKGGCGSGDSKKASNTQGCCSNQNSANNQKKDNLIPEQDQDQADNDR